MHGGNIEKKMTECKIYSTKVSIFFIFPNHNARKINHIFSKNNFNELQRSQNVTKSALLFCLEFDEVFIVHLLEEQ